MIVNAMKKEKKRKTKTKTKEKKRKPNQRQLVLDGQIPFKQMTRGTRGNLTL
jgi:hypothetical protein